MVDSRTPFFDNDTINLRCWLLYIYATDAGLCNAKIILFHLSNFMI